jgi:hypothetical protein
MLLGVEKRRKQQEEELESAYAFRSQLNHLDETGRQKASPPFLFSNISVCDLFSFSLGKGWGGGFRQGVKDVIKGSNWIMFLHLLFYKNGRFQSKLESISHNVCRW